MSELSPSEKRIYDYVSQTILKKGYSPSIRDIQNALSIKSTSTVHSYLARLENAGYIYKENGKSRTIRIGRKPGELKNKVPLLGEIREDSPLNAEKNFDGYVDFVIPRDMPPDSLLAYRVQTDLEQHGIIKNDILIIEKSNSPKTSDTVLLTKEGTPEIKAFDPLLLSEYALVGRIIALLRSY